MFFMDRQGEKELISLLKLWERNDRRNEQKRRYRLSDPFAGTGMRKRGLYNENT